MAFTQITMHGTKDNLKQAFTKVNTLITDLLSTSSGKGASQIGLRDTAGNFDAENVEDFAAEIYTDVTSARTLADTLDEDTATTTSLTWGYKAGSVRFDNTVTAITAGTISLTDDATNYVEINSSALVTKNTTGFTTGCIPIRQILTADGAQSTSTDKRVWFPGTVAATATNAGVVELATNAEVVTGTDTTRAVTPAGLQNKAASATAKGIVELATNAETLIGSDTTRAVTADDVKHILSKTSVIQRSIFTYNGGATAYTIKTKSGRYYCKDKYCYWNAEVTTNAIGTPGASDWYYLYLDYSAITSGTEITATELIWSNTEPAWSSTYGAWMNGDDLCIFADKTNAGPTNILEFFPDGDFVLYADSIVDNVAQDIASNWSSGVTLTVPIFARKVKCFFQYKYIDTDQGAYWRRGQQTGTIGHRIGDVSNSAAPSNLYCSNTIDVICCETLDIDVKDAGAATNTLAVETLGWYFPIGM